MREGDAENDIPVMDPFGIKAYDLNFDTGALRYLLFFILHNTFLYMYSNITFIIIVWTLLLKT